MFNKKTDQQLHAISWTLLHCMFFTTMTALARYLAEDISIITIFFLQSMLATAILGPIAIIRRQDFQKSTLHLHFFSRNYWHPIHADLPLCNYISSTH